MRFDTSQQLRLEQSMRLSPRIIQAMEILQLPMMALQERIEAELQSNPVLEMGASPDLESQESGEPSEAPHPERAMVVDPANGEGFARVAEFYDEYGGEFPRSDAPSRARQLPGERDRKMDAMANTPAPGASLQEYLLGQWAFVEAPPPVKRAGTAVIECIDDDGYLRVDLEELAARTEPPLPPDDVRAALRLVQSLDPPGVGARNLKECLALQLAVETAGGRDMSLETELVNHYLPDIEANRLPHIARRAGKSVDSIKRAIENLSRLSPRPGSLVGGSGAPAITPDVMVAVNDAGEPVVTMPRDTAPRLYISGDYRKMAKDRNTDSGARRFLRQKMQAAQWLIGAIEQRRNTVRRVTEEVFKAQRDFLESGPEALRPLPMAQVAQKIGVHVATVSRAVSGKHVQTPRGIYPLRMFFSGGTRTQAGQDIAWDAVRVKLKEVVDAEDRSQPLNDDEIAERLSQHGINIARRTVAKYRDILEIPPARKRRTY